MAEPLKAGEVKRMRGLLIASPEISINQKGLYTSFSVRIANTCRKNSHAITS